MPELSYFQRFVRVRRIVVFPEVRQGQEIHRDAADIGDGDGASVGGGIGPAGGRLQEIDQGIAAAGTAALGHIGALRAIVDRVDRIEVGVRENDDADVGIEFEVHVVGALGAVPVRDEAGVSVAGDKAQGRNEIPLGGAGGVGEEQAAQRGWQRAGVVQLDEIVVGGELGIGQPFVDFQMTIIAEWQGDIGGAEGRRAQRPAAILRAAD